MIIQITKCQSIYLNCKKFCRVAKYLCGPMVGNHCCRVSVKDGHGSGVRLQFSNPDFIFWVKVGSGFDMNGYNVNEMYVKSWQRWAQSRIRSLKIWRLTGTGFGVLVFGAGSSLEVNFLTPPISGVHC